MSGLLGRYSSYGSSSGSASHHIRPSPLQAASSPPTDPFPPTLNTLKPSDVLINRSHQIKRFAKHLSLYFQQLAQAHHQHFQTLSKLPSTIPLPIQEQSIFIPPTGSIQNDHHQEGEVAPLGGTGQEGWASILQGIKDTNQKVAEAHAELAKKINKDVVGPLTKLRETMKGHINSMEKDINRLCDAVQKERDLTSPIIARLTQSLTTIPIRPQIADDPLVIRAQLEQQLSNQISKENDLLQAVKNWTEKTEAKEKEVLAELARCWRDWESSNSSMLLGNQQLSMFLSGSIDAVPPEAEWLHFLRLNHSIPPTTRNKTIDDVEWEGKGDERCKVVKEGTLERQTSFLKSWKPAYFILTPTGLLLLYPPPTPTSKISTHSRASTASISSSTSPSSLPAPPPTHHSISSSGYTSPPSSSVTTEPTSPSLSTSDRTIDPSDELSSSSSTYATLSPQAFHLLTTSSPLLVLNLPTCSLGPMPTPSPPSPQSPSTSSASPSSSMVQKKKGGSTLDAAFTIMENQGKGTKHVIRIISSTHNNKNDSEGEGELGDSWEEMGNWVKEISRFTVPAPVVSVEEQNEVEVSSTTTTKGGPPPLPSRSISGGGLPPLPGGGGSSTNDLNNSSSSTSLHQNNASIGSGRDNVPAITPASTSIFGGFFGGGGKRREESVSSVATTNTSTSLSTTKSIDEAEEGGGVPPPLPPRERSHQFSPVSGADDVFGQGGRGGEGGQEEDLDFSERPISIERNLNNNEQASEEDEVRTPRMSQDDEDAGDLGRSLSPPPPPPVPARGGGGGGGGGRVANLAKAFDQEAASSSSKVINIRGEGGGKAQREEQDREIEEEKEEEGQEEEGEGEEGSGDLGGGGGGAKKGSKKGKKKRKSKGGNNNVKTIEIPERPLPIPSTSPKSSDLSLASPPLDNSILDDEDDVDSPFDLSLSHLKLDHDHEGDLSGGNASAGPGDLSFDEEKLRREYGEGIEDEEEETVKSPPPMVLEEVEEAPASSLDHHDDNAEEEPRKE